ncbi:MAG: translational GTPase TypA [Bacilli bacterium]|nr:translational GTPase TypA [Bacillota bacterium]MBR6821284.1 translational GTPase TypA [Bacilli bacterium]
MDKIINIAVVAHVDAGKSTLVDALLEQNGVFRANEEVAERVMDSDDIEKERGITIYSKNCAIRYDDYKINIVDTPGHADFSSEVERIMKTVDTVILLVDAAEGPMPQTRFVLKKALEQNLRPILFINKIDKKDARPQEVVDMTFELFMELNATDEQLDFPIVYGIAREGKATLSLDEEGTNIQPLLETVLKQCSAYEGNEEDPLQMQVSSLDYDSFIGRLGIGRVTRGKIKNGQTVALSRNDGSVSSFRISKLFVSEGIKRVEKEVAYYGDIVIFAGCPDISIGDTVCDKDHVEAMEPIIIERPTLSMDFLVNSSPFAGKDKTSKFLTSRHIKERLDKELETNVGLEVEELPGSDGFKVSGRGELHLSILLENMRREGYELSVSKPEVLYKEIDGVKCEPFEKVIVNCPGDYSGTIINDLQERKAILEVVSSDDNNYAHLEFSAPTRGLIGYRSAFITNTKGEGVMVRSFEDYKPYVGEISGRKNGVLVTMENGKTLGFSLFNLQERGTMIVGPAEEVYVGMVVGIHNRDNDLNVNPCKNKQLTNTRASGSDEAIALIKPKTFSLEEALEFIQDDELVEVTPSAIRIRKKILDPNERFRVNRK